MEMSAKDSFGADQPPLEVLLIDKPDKELECPVCYDLMSDASSFIPCGHTACNKCILKLKSRRWVPSLPRVVVKRSS